MPKSKKNGMAFLEQLDKELHYIETCESGCYAGCQRDAFHEERKMTKEEIDEVLKVVQKEGLPFFPINANHMFDTGFEVARTVDVPGAQRADGSHLVFLEAQLPKGYDFDALSKVFNSERNIEIMKFYKMDRSLPKGKEHYRY